ncbi:MULTISPECIES: hypothetical protein [Halomicrobium]|nr:MULTISPECIES: hypothetical protein [Halomicrobium]QCD64471.1 hypothetical protein E5139_02015 [Halomicrobium mukohataei]QFR19277.1 hypothetical protein GBQ70_02015 [Halomicrobium sp. ZPS1]
MAGRTQTLPTQYMIHEKHDTDTDAQLDLTELTELLRSLAGPTPRSERYQIADPDRPVVYVFERQPGQPLEHVATEPADRNDSARPERGAR